MTSITLDWDRFKQTVNALDFDISYADINGNYYLYAYSEFVEYVCVIDKNASEDFESNYKQYAITLI